MDLIISVPENFYTITNGNFSSFGIFQLKSPFYNKKYVYYSLINVTFMNLQKLMGLRIPRILNIISIQIMGAFGEN